MFDQHMDVKHQSAMLFKKKKMFKVQMFVQNPDGLTLKIRWK